MKYFIVLSLLSLAASLQAGRDLKEGFHQQHAKSNPRTIGMKKPQQPYNPDIKCTKTNVSNDADTDAVFLMTVGAMLAVAQARKAESASLSHSLHS